MPITRQERLCLLAEVERVQRVIDSTSDADRAAWYVVYQLLHRFDVVGVVSLGRTDEDDLVRDIEKALDVVEELVDRLGRADGRGPTSSWKR